MASALRHVAITYAFLADFIGCVGEIYRLEIVQRRKDHCSLHTVLIMLNFQIGLWVARIGNDQVLLLQNFEPWQWPGLFCCRTLNHVCLDGIVVKLAKVNTLSSSYVQHDRVTVVVFRGGGAMLLFYVLSEFCADKGSGRVNSRLLTAEFQGWRLELVMCWYIQQKKEAEDVWITKEPSW